MKDVTVWYLEMCAETDLKPSSNPGEIEIHEVKVKQFQFNRFLYQLVGDAWKWHDKLDWSDAQWRDYAEADNLLTWVAWQEGAPAGYFELQTQADGAVEICYFGLAAKFMGRGIGGYLLTTAIREAWALAATRVTLNTCSLDHPNALSNYQARGFSIYKSELERRA